MAAKDAAPAEEAAKTEDAAPAEEAALAEGAAPAEDTPNPEPPADAAPTDTAPEPAPEAEPEADVTVRMKIEISGTRNGETWPKPGETITLPADEARTYIALGYAALATE